MRDVKLVRLSEDGTHLVLAHEGTGEEFALRIDDRIRGAVVSDRARIGQLPVERPSRLRPKEIQSRLRAGESSEEIASAADVSLERILRYAGPVLAERQYIAEQARRCVLRRQAGEAAGRSLDQVVTARFESYGVEPARAEWDAWRAADGRWVVAVNYQLDGEEQRATFSYDPAGRLVVPSDEAARAMVEGPRTDPSADNAGPAAVHGPAPRTPRDGSRLRLAPLPSPQAAPEVFAGDPDTGARDAEVRPLRPAPAPPASPAAPSTPAAASPAGRSAGEQDEGRFDAVDAEETVDLSRTLGRQPGALRSVGPPTESTEPGEPTEPGGSADPVEPVPPVQRLHPADPLRPQEPAPEVLPDRAETASSRAAGPRPVRPEPVRSEPVRSEPVRPEPVRPEPEPAREPAAEEPPDRPVPVREVPAPPADEPAGTAPEPVPAEPVAPGPAVTELAEEVAEAARQGHNDVPATTRAEPEPPPEPAPEPQPEPEAEPEPKPVRRPKPANANAQRKRASRAARKGSVPSWDDILFGGKK